MLTSFNVIAFDGEIYDFFSIAPKCYYRTFVGFLKFSLLKLAKTVVAAFKDFMPKNGTARDLKVMLLPSHHVKSIGSTYVQEKSTPILCQRYRLIHKQLHTPPSV